MKPWTLRKHVFLGLTLLSVSASKTQAIALPTSGTLNITILDEDGALVPNAPLYIFGESNPKFVGGKEIQGTATLNMPAGKYRLSSAVMRKTGEYYDRFASREAHIEIIAGDNAMVILRLYALDNTVIAAANQNPTNAKNGGDQFARMF